MGLYAGLQQFKAALHVHTTNSDGSVRLDDMVEMYYAQGYDLLAITDHNRITNSWVNPPTSNGLLYSRYEEMTLGIGRSRPMLMIPNTTEQSRSTAPADHINTFMTSFLSTVWPTLLTQVEQQNGIAHINHLGRYINTAPAGIGKYLDMLKFPGCIGIEMISTHYPNNNDRPIWDEINGVTIPQGRIVWGFANDDAHLMTEVGQCWNVMVMPDNTTEDLRQAMRDGFFYGVARRSPFEGVPSPVGEPPMITDIELGSEAISLTATNHTRIDWITEGTVTVGNGASLSLGASGIGRFVRANVIGPGGVAYTQPFRVRRQRRSMIEVLSRLSVATAPIEDNEVVRKRDLDNISAGGIGFFQLVQEDGDLFFVYDLGVRPDMFEVEANGDFFYNFPGD